mgnify:CR=1 FL=1
MSWPVTVNGTTYTQNDFFGPNGFEYVDNWPLLIQDMLAVANSAQVASNQATTTVTNFTQGPFGDVNPEDTMFFADVSDNDSERRVTLQDHMIQASIMMENF